MEFISNNFSEINWWAVLVAVISTLPVGYLWYDLKFGFGRRWAKLIGLKPRDLESSEGMAKTFSVMLVTSLITAILLALFVYQMGIYNWLDGVLFGAMLGLVLRGGAHFIHNGFTHRPMQLTLIDAGHDMVSLAVMGLILSIWK